MEDLIEPFSFEEREAVDWFVGSRVSRFWEDFFLRALERARVMEEEVVGSGGAEMVVVMDGMEPLREVVESVIFLHLPFQAHSFRPRIDGYIVVASCLDGSISKDKELKVRRSLRYKMGR